MYHGNTIHILQTRHTQFLCLLWIGHKDISQVIQILAKILNTEELLQFPNQKIE